MSTGHILPYKHEEAWLVIRNLRWIASDLHSFESWTGDDWSSRVSVAQRFDSQKQADTYIEENHERLLGARMA